MGKSIETCPIWGSSYKAEGFYDPRKKIYDVQESERAFAGYIIKEPLLKSMVEHMSDSKKAGLTTWLIDQWCRGNDQPEVTIGILLGLDRRRPLPVHVRADRLLKLISLNTKSQQLGKFVSFPWHWHAGFAWSESTDRSDVQFILAYLEKKGWLERDPFGPEIGDAAKWRVSVEGHTRVDVLERGENSSATSQSFIAMWFTESMVEAFEKGIKPAIEGTGYDPLRIDRKEHINKIDDEIIAEIRRSKFLVADFTHGADGARGGVYYEAGFAKGLGIPVIFTCREDALETLHFDTSHYNHIVWKHPSDLHEKLKNRILAVIGEGPGLNSIP